MLQSFVGGKEKEKKLNKCVLPNAPTGSELNRQLLHWIYSLSSFSATVVAMTKDRTSYV
jgi:hypothetical protein